MPDPKLKYQQLLAYGKKLPSMPQEDHADENKVRGCVSQVQRQPSTAGQVVKCMRRSVYGSENPELEGILFHVLAEGLVQCQANAVPLMHALRLQVWVKPQVRDGKIYWLADSDSALTKVMFKELYLLPVVPTVSAFTACAASCAGPGCLAGRHPIPCCRWS